MKIQIRTKNIKLTDHVQETIRQKILFALDRISDRIMRVAIFIKDLNGPKGGTDKECCLIIKPLGVKEVVIKEVQADLLTVIDQALDRGERAVLRTLGRQRQMSFGRGNPLSYYDRCLWGFKKPI